MKCSCGEDMRVTHERQIRPGVAHREYLCDGCGSRAATTQERGAAEVEVWRTAPQAELDAAEQARIDREAEGIREFLSIGGRRHVRTLP